MKKALKMTRVEAWFLLIAGLLVGTIFTFGMQYWNAPIAERDAITDTAIFASYDIRRGRSGSTKEVIVRFEDRDQLYIDGVCASSALINQLKMLQKGDEVMLTIHPNSNTILELELGNLTLLEFDQTTKKLTNEATGFGVLGMLCYAAALTALVQLMQLRKTRRLITKRSICVKKPKSHRIGIRVLAAVLLLLGSVLLLTSDIELIMLLVISVPIVLIVLPLVLFCETWMIAFDNQYITQYLLGFEMITHSYRQIKKVTASRSYTEGAVIHILFLDGKTISFREVDENAQAAIKRIKSHCSIDDCR